MFFTKNNMPFRKSKTYKSLLELNKNVCPEIISSFISSYNFADENSYNQLTRAGIYKFYFDDVRLPTVIYNVSKDLEKLQPYIKEKYYGIKRPDKIDIILQFNENIISRTKDCTPEQRKEYFINILMFNLGRVYLQHYNKYLEGYVTNVDQAIFKAYGDFIKKKCTDIKISDKHLDTVMKFMFDNNITFSKGAYVYENDIGKGEG